MVRETSIQTLYVAGGLAIASLAAGCAEVPGLSEALLRNGISMPSFLASSSAGRLNEDFILAVSTGTPTGLGGLNNGGGSVAVLPSVPILTTAFGPTFNTGLAFGPAVNEGFGPGFNSIGFGPAFNTGFRGTSVGFTNPEFLAGFTTGFNTPGFANAPGFPIFSGLNVGRNDPFFNTPGGVPVAGLSNPVFSSTIVFGSSVSGS